MKEENSHERKAALLFAQNPDKDVLFMTHNGKAFWLKSDAEAAGYTNLTTMSRKKLASDAGLEADQKAAEAKAKEEQEAQEKAQQEAAEAKAKQEQEAQEKAQEKAEKEAAEAKAKEEQETSMESKGTALLEVKGLNKFRREELADLLNEWDVEFDLKDPRGTLMTLAVNEKKERGL